MPPSLSRRVLLTTALVTGLARPAYAQALSKGAAIALAESFVAKNGYTNLPPEQIAARLDPESLEWGRSREEQVRYRVNTLVPKAIGIKKGTGRGQTGWSVAFDYVSGGANSETCRVVTMSESGTNLVVQHVDGIRKYFAGFD
jgi:hypothetical protein